MSALAVVVRAAVLAALASIVQSRRTQVSAPLEPGREGADTYRNASASRASLPLNEGDSFECAGFDGKPITFTLGDKLGQGMFGAVFKTSDPPEAYAVKVETNDPDTQKRGWAWWAQQDYAHECGVMRHLEAKGLNNIPKCHALCNKEGKKIMVMDLLKDSKDIQGLYDDYIADNDATWTPATANLAGQELYRAAIAMLRAGVVNTDQTGQNIMTRANGSIYPIDFGLANVKEDFMDRCAKVDASALGSVTHEANIFGGQARLLEKYGRGAACEAEWRELQAVTLQAMLKSVFFVEEANDGIYAAFCKDQALDILANDPGHTIAISFSPTHKMANRPNFKTAIQEGFLEGSKSEGYRWKKKKGSDPLNPDFTRFKDMIPDGAQLVQVEMGEKVLEGKDLPDIFKPHGASSTSRVVSEVFDNIGVFFFKPAEDEGMVPGQVKRAFGDYYGKLLENYDWATHTCAGHKPAEQPSKLAPSKAMEQAEQDEAKAMAPKNEAKAREKAEKNEAKAMDEAKARVKAEKDKAKARAERDEANADNTGEGMRNNPVDGEEDTSFICKPRAKPDCTKGIIKAQCPKLCG